MDAKTMEETLDKAEVNKDSPEMAEGVTGTDKVSPDNAAQME